MKSLQSIGVVFLILSLTTSAQERQKPDLLVFAGLSFPAGPESFSDNWKMGFNFGGGLAYPLTSEFFLVGSFEYNNFAFDGDGFLRRYGATGLGITITGGSASIISITGSLKRSFPLPGSASPYVFGGGGFFHLSLSDVTISGGGTSSKVEGGSKSALSGSLGAGIDIAAGKSAMFFLEGKFELGFTADEDDGGRTMHLPLRGGLRIRL